jgi:spore coat protein CotH
LNHKLTNETEPAVLFYDGVLYDGVQARIRGQSARYWTKPPWKFYMTQGHELAAPDVFDTTVDTFDLQSNWSDKAFMREVLAWETHRDSGGISCQAHPVHVQKDGAFFGLYTFLEAPELDWVERNGLDPDGSRYKAFDDLRSYSYYDNIVPKYEKKSRLYEDHTDIFIFTNGLNNLTGQQLRDFLYDNVDIPKTLNYLATQIIIHNNDHIKKNYFVYRDTEGTQRWTMQPWDLDLTFGRNWVYDVLVDTIWADVDYLTGLSDISPSHPYFGTSDRQKLGGAWNRLIDRLLDEDDIRQMYCRRLRSLMDELLPVGRYESRVDELAALIGTEVPLDHTEWGQWGQSQDLSTAVTILKDEYLNPRRVHLYTTHGTCSIPGPQGVTPNILINEIMYNPTGGLDDEFIELYNPSLTDAVDISGWRLDGLALTVPPGTVILPQGYALFVRNDPQFRTTYGGGMFVAAQYAGSLDDLGESIVMRNRYGGVINAVAYDDADPWPAGAAGGGYSLELIDSAQDNAKVVNWGASSSTGGTPGAANSIQGTITGVPALYINEVLPDNVSINQDEGPDYDPWIEIYNASSQSIDLGGMYLSNDFGVPDMWQIPASTRSRRRPT